MGGRSGNRSGFSPLGVTVFPIKVGRGRIVDDGGGIAVILAGGQEAGIAVAGWKTVSRTMSGGWRGPAAGVSGCCGLRRFRLFLERRGPPGADIHS